MLREITDRSVLDEVFRQGEVTRAALATTTGISKPTISEAVRRLTEAGLLRETGSRTGRRGRVAAIYQLDPRSGWVLAVEINQEGIRTRSADLSGTTFDDQQRPPVRAGDTDAMIAALRDTVRTLEVAGRRRHGPLRSVTLAVANPVHPETRQIVALPHSPFPEGLVQPDEVLADLVEVPLVVENDVNLEALAERRMGAARDAASFAYLHIGAGLGLALGIGDDLIRGARGLAGEIGYLPIPHGDDHRSLTEALRDQGFGRPDSPSLDVRAVTDMINSAATDDQESQASLETFARPLAQAIAAICVVQDPELVLLGGPIGTHPALVAAIHQALPTVVDLPVSLTSAELIDAPALSGALQQALESGRHSLVSAG